MPYDKLSIILNKQNAEDKNLFLLTFTMTGTEHHIEFII